MTLSDWLVRCEAMEKAERDIHTPRREYLRVWSAWDLDTTTARVRALIEVAQEAIDLRKFKNKVCEKELDKAIARLDEALKETP